MLKIQVLAAAVAWSRLPSTGIDVATDRLVASSLIMQFSIFE
jgi:hypothetical protein